MPKKPSSFKGLEAYVTKFYRYFPLKIDLTFIDSGFSIIVLDFDKTSIDAKSVKWSYMTVPDSTSEMVKGFKEPSWFR